MTAGTTGGQTRSRSKCWRWSWEEIRIDCLVSGNVEMYTIQIHLKCLQPKNQMLCLPCPPRSYHISHIQTPGSLTQHYPTVALMMPTRWQVSVISCPVVTPSVSALTLQRCNTKKRASVPRRCHRGIAEVFHVAADGDRRVNGRSWCLRLSRVRVVVSLI